MTSGHIKCFFHAKGYGYIEDFDGHEVYFHYTSVEGATSTDITEGAPVYFDVINTGIGLEAHRVTISKSLSA